MKKWITLQNLNIEEFDYLNNVIDLRNLTHSFSTIFYFLVNFFLSWLILILFTFSIKSTCKIFKKKKNWTKLIEKIKNFWKQMCQIFHIVILRDCWYFINNPIKVFLTYVLIFHCYNY